jgi:hypothetical protein
MNVKNILLLFNNITSITSHKLQNMNTDETIMIICSFLQPLALCRMRYLSSYHHRICDRWLERSHRTIDLQDKACPRCGDWIETEDIRGDTTFYDLLYGDIQSMEDYRMMMNRTFLYYHERQNILCESCGNDEEEIENIRFRYKGNRKYQLTLVHHPTHPWAVISHSNGWNEFRTFIPAEYDDDDEMIVPIEQINVI